MKSFVIHCECLLRSWIIEPSLQHPGVNLHPPSPRSLHFNTGLSYRSAVLMWRSARPFSSLEKGRLVSVLSIWCFFFPFSLQQAKAFFLLASISRNHVFISVKRKKTKKRWHFFWWAGGGTTQNPLFGLFWAYSVLGFHLSFSLSFVFIFPRQSSRPVTYEN